MRREFDVISLVSGLAFLAVGAGVFLDAINRIHVDPAWAGPVLLIALGLIGLLASIRRTPAPPRSDEGTPES